MKSFLLSALQAIIKTLITSVNYEMLKQMILNANDSALTGEEKKQLVLKEAAPIIDAMGRDLVSLAMKAIVLSVRGGK